MLSLTCNRTYLNGLAAIPKVEDIPLKNSSINTKPGFQITKENIMVNSVKGC